jgi:protease secretion system membrane fusion protein
MKSWLNKLKQMAERQPVDGPQMQQPSTDIARVTRFGMLSLLIGFGGFLAWAAWAPLDEGVPASGLVIVDSKRKAIQHLQGGIVEKILVRDGDLVKVHQPLIKLDQTQVGSILSTVRNNYWQSQAAVRSFAGRAIAPQQDRVFARAFEGGNTPSPRPG